MTSAAESFVIELGRASRRSNYLLRGLQGADRDDVTAAAILWCWAHRSEFVAPIETWFRDALEQARREHRRHSRRASQELAEITVLDTTQRTAESQIAAEQIASRLSSTEQKVAVKIAEGHTLKEIGYSLGMTIPQVFRMRRKIRTLDMIPGITEYVVTPGAGDSDDDTRKLAPIDHEIEKLLRRPKHERADCVPCWRCMYFEGLTPKSYKPPDLTAPEICDAVASTEARKIRIGNGERLGT